jgi:hypothetical protein
MQKSWIMILALVFSFEYAATARAQSFLGQKAAVKKASRWTLEEWLATKERMQWSNLWLSFNSPSPYEFFVLGGMTLAPSSIRYGLGAYATGVGLEYEKETTLDSAWNARFHLRVFGVNVQNTNLTLLAGIRGRDAGGGFRQGYAGVSGTLYLRKFLGVFLQYRSHFGSTPTALGKVSGERFELGPFVDFGPVRVFGYYLIESETASDLASGYARSVSQWTLGGQLFL